MVTCSLCSLIRPTFTSWSNAVNGYTMSSGHLFNPPVGAVMTPWTACRATPSHVLWPLRCPYGSGQPANPKQSPLCWEPVRGPSTQLGDHPGTTLQGPPLQRPLSLVRAHPCMFDRRLHDWARKVLSKTYSCTIAKNIPWNNISSICCILSLGV